jgi:hypothetical protein
MSAVHVTNSMEQGPSWGINSKSASQEINNLLRKPKVQYDGYKTPPMVPIVSHMHPVHTFPSYFYEIRSNIILTSTPRSSEWSLPFRFHDQNFVCTSHLTHAYHMPHSSHPPW